MTILGHTTTFHLVDTKTVLEDHEPFLEDVCRPKKGPLPKRPSNTLSGRLIVRKDE